MSEPKHNRTHWLHLRLTAAEHALLHRRCRGTTCRKMSDYARRKLLDRPLTVLYRDQSLDECMGELVLLRRELAGLGHNFNQAVKKLHTLSLLPEFSQWLAQWTAARDRLLAKTGEIQGVTDKIADRWLR